MDPSSRRSGSTTRMGTMSRRGKAKDTVVSAEFDGEQAGALDAFIERLLKAKKVAEVEVLNITGKELASASPKLAGAARAFFSVFLR